MNIDDEIENDSGSEKFFLPSEEKVDLLELKRAEFSNDMFDAVRPGPTEEGWEASKTCSSCKKVKSLELFSKDKRKPDGYKYICKECYKIVDARRYYKYRERILEETKKRYDTPEGRQKALVKEKLARTRYPEKAKARQDLRNAVMQGKILKPTSCSVDNCLKKPQAHHYLGYEGEHWKDVKWLCRAHHMELHRKYDTGVWTMTDEELKKELEAERQKVIEEGEGYMYWAENGGGYKDGFKKYLDELKGRKGK